MYQPTATWNGLVHISTSSLTIINKEKYLATCLWHIFNENKFINITREMRKQFILRWKCERLRREFYQIFLIFKVLFKIIQKFFLCITKFNADQLYLLNQFTFLPHRCRSCLTTNFSLNYLTEKSHLHVDTITVTQCYDTYMTLLFCWRLVTIFIFNLGFEISSCDDAKKEGMRKWVTMIIRKVISIFESI